MDLDGSVGRYLICILCNYENDRLYFFVGFCLG